MQIIKSFQIILLTLLLFNISVAQTSDESEKIPCIPCEQMMKVRLPDVKISQSEQIQEPVPHCKVSGVIGTEINFELLLPNSWNTRFIMGGGGGFVGSVQNQVSWTINHGYATVGTDTGHQGEGISGGWALNNMERQLNFAHLAVHRTAVVSKEIIRQFYCFPADYSYFVGCSQGGSQGMMEAQRYPDDFDGVVAGAPAFNKVAIGAKNIQNAQAMYPNPTKLDEPFLSTAKLALLQTKILKKCDAIDGVKDQIINDPMACDFTIDLLPLCPENTDRDDCFTSNQIDAIKTVYAGVYDQGIEIHPGFPFGGENEKWGWFSWIVGPNQETMRSGFPTLQFGIGTEMLKYLVFQDPDWDYSSYDFSDFSNTTGYASAYLDATSTDYSAFKKSGKKMILYHGWSDNALSALATINHYETVEKEDEEIRDYIRLFLLPGVLHCGGGPGPGHVNWINIIRNWVENGIAPERVILSKSADEKVSMTRPVFPYPIKAIYNGEGDPNIESSFNKSTPTNKK